MAAECISQLPRDLLVEILGRVDDSFSLASAASACTCLRGAVAEESLWAELCRRAWPSTGEKETREIVSSMPGGFAKLYADSLPLLIYGSDCRSRSSATRRTSTATASSELISFVDVRYKKKCFLSRIVRILPLHGDSLRECPFKVDAMGDLAVCVGICGDGGNEKAVATPSILLEPKEEGGVGVLNWALEEDLFLSWVLLHVESGRAVNLSGGQPTSVQRDYPSKGDVVLSFGCAVPVDKHLLPAGLAECAISVRCRLLEEEAGDNLSFVGIELQVKDADGEPVVDRERSLAVLERVLCWEKRCSRKGGAAAAAGYRAYLKDCRERREKAEAAALERPCAVALAGVVLVVVASYWLLSGVLGM